MHRLIRHVEFQCDTCSATVEVVVTGFYIHPPDDWDQYDLCGQGMTDYCKTFDRCPDCREKGITA
jgi:hypothetical protein